MGDKAKNIIVDVLKSDEVKEYLCGVVSSQLEEAMDSFQEMIKAENAGQVQNLRTQIDVLTDKGQEFENENKRLKIELVEKEKQLEELRKEKKRTLEEKDALFSQMISIQEQCKHFQEEKEGLLSCLSEYENRFFVINNAFSVYMKLPEQLKQRIGNIFKKQNIGSFIVAISDWNNIEGLWGFVKRRIIEEETLGLPDLVELFLDAFSVFNSIDGNDIYELIHPMNGEKYDSDKHSIKGTKTDGVINKVLLPGVYDKSTNKSLLKAFVEVR